MSRRAPWCILAPDFVDCGEEISHAEHEQRTLTEFDTTCNQLPEPLRGIVPALLEPGESLKLSLEFFATKRTGDLVARISSDTDRICNFLSEANGSRSPSPRLGRTLARSCETIPIW